MKKATIIFFLLIHYSFNLNAQWETIAIDLLLNNWAATRIDALSDNGSLIFYGPATPVDTNGQTIINGFLFSTYNQSEVKNRVLVNNPIRSIVEFQGDTIVTGSFHTVYHIDSFPAVQASIQRVMLLTNDSMQQLGSFNAACRAKVIGNDLYIFGHFSEAMGDSCNVIKWDGEQWEPIGPPIWASHHEIRDIAYYNNELYIAGNILMNNGLRDILVLREGEWQEVGVTIPAGIASFNKLEVYNGELYAAGGIRKLDGFAGNMIQSWNGELWQEVGNSLYFTSPSSYAEVKDMKAHGDYLYVSGAFLTAGGIDAPGIARWDGSQWCGLYTQYPNNIMLINSFAFTGGELYLREPFYSIPTDNPAFIRRYLMGDEVFPCSEVFTGLDDEAEDDFSLLPNPCTNHFSLEFQQETLQPLDMVIYTLTGQQVKSDQLSGNQRHTIDVSGLEAGMYVVQLMEQGQVVGTTKLVVQP